ncbi:putative sporulation protein YtxC [Romboutsia sedimentorum]|uniref:Sporulation protein YtxC n=1 Tax=Romboutsia sedimentorum TaxID=1368474 RepID=A0ABT7ECF4_9FIRM|nr:putative sporulation protein YtxC [Romboutsia sedimentorum]MDK2564605.1 putative sporulation protein YtxC [Romboutsia sedimentorum]MDK2586494.1 putative sporulation protein YtxC [Romboutsia sedimentorum]
MKNIYLTLSEQDKAYAMKFLNSNNLKKELKYDDELVEIEISSDKQNEINKKEATEEITDLIIGIMKDKMLKEHLSKQYHDTYLREDEKIYMHLLDLFVEKENLIRQSVYSAVYNYIQNNDYINLEGFVKFRMKGFSKYISHIVDIAVEEYILKKDQDEFINVLKYFIDMQDEKIDLLKVHIMKDNSFLLYDKDGNRIDNIDNQEIVNMIIKENLNYEDFLISTLLTLCPKKIEILDTLNNNASKEIIETIKSIFVNKVVKVYEN